MHSMQTTSFKIKQWDEPTLALMAQLQDLTLVLGDGSEVKTTRYQMLILSTMYKDMCRPDNLPTHISIPVGDRNVVKQLNDCYFQSVKAPVITTASFFEVVDFLGMGIPGRADFKLNNEEINKFVLLYLNHNNGCIDWGWKHYGVYRRIKDYKGLLHMFIEHGLHKDCLQNKLRYFIQLDANSFVNDIEVSRLLCCIVEKYQLAWPIKQPKVIVRDKDPVLSKIISEPSILGPLMRIFSFKKGF